MICGSRLIATAFTGLAGRRLSGSSLARPDQGQDELSPTMLRCEAPAAEAMAITSHDGSIDAS